MSRTILLLMLSLAAPALAAQDRSVVLPDQTSNDDVIVRALHIPREKLPTGVYWNYQSMLPLRIVRENSELFLRCAMRLDSGRWVSEVVDGEPNSANARFAQGSIIENHRGCYPTIRSAGLVWSNVPNSIADLGQSRVDRGVIVEAVLKTFAADAELTPAMTNDPVVQNRFRQREGYRNRLRLPEDRDALRFAACLVEEQPILATRLVRSAPGSALERGLTQTIIVEGRQCVGGASHVTIDPTLARVYIVDAFYRWVVAARGVETLIPAAG